MSELDLGNVAAIIPAFDPDQALVTLARELLQRGLGRVVVVDDGSSPGCQAPFDELAGLPGVELLRHAANAGKGRALKTAFAHCLSQHPGLDGVVTADADGQHRAEDIVATAQAMLRSGQPALGVRSFGSDVPWRSRLGNSLTRRLFSLLYGHAVRDTQTGLRALPTALLAMALEVPGDRYEYETSQLIALVRAGTGLQQVAIATIYLDGNRSSHFNPLLDSLRIYFVFLRFSASSLLTAAIDLACFATCLALSGHTLLSLAVGRCVAIGFNFATNSRFVFKRSADAWVFARYLLVVVAMTALAYVLMQQLQKQFGSAPITAKIVVETALFVLSFSLQRAFVFVSRKGER